MKKWEFSASIKWSSIRISRSSPYALSGSFIPKNKIMTALSNLLKTVFLFCTNWLLTLTLWSYFSKGFFTFWISKHCYAYLNKQKHFDANRTLGLYWTFWNMYQQFVLPWSTLAELDLLLFFTVLFWASFAESSGWKSMSSPSPFSNSSSIGKNILFNYCHNL